MEELNKIIHDYTLSLGERLDAWSEWCKLFDEKEAEEASKPKSEFEL